MLNQSQIDRYWQTGWLVVNDIFTRDEATDVADLAWEICSREIADGTTSSLDRGDDGEQLPRKLEQPFLKHERFKQMALDERLVAALTDLMPEPPLLARDQLFMKPPRFGSAKPYHQDNYYFRCSPPDHVITAWIALDDVDEQNGCLRYISGTHREGILAHEPLPGEPHNLAIPEELVDRSKEELAEVRKGGVVFHHGETLHTSHRNESDRWRRAYATHWLTASVTSEADYIIDEAYFNRDG